jgi:hypothetical protein
MKIFEDRVQAYLARSSFHPPHSLGRAKEKQLPLPDSSTLDVPVHALVANAGGSARKAAVQHTPRTVNLASP